MPPIPDPGIEERFLASVNEALVAGMRDAVLAWAMAMVLAALRAASSCRSRFSAPRRTKSEKRAFSGGSGRMS